MTQAKVFLGCVLPGHTKFMFVNYSITKYIKFQPINNQQKQTFAQCQIELGFMETVLEIILYILSKNLNK